MDPEIIEAPAAEAVASGASTPDDSLGLSVDAELLVALRQESADRASAGGSLPDDPTAAPTAPVAEAAEDPAAEGAASKPAGSTPETEADDPRPLSRRERGQLAREAIEQFEAERVRREQAEAALATKTREDQEVFGRVSSQIGDAETYDALVAKTAEGDFDAAEQLKEMRATRRIYTDVRRVVEAEEHGRLGADYQTAYAFEGVDSNVLANVPRLADALKHIYDAGRAAEAARWTAQQAKDRASNHAQVTRLAAELPTPERGGRSTGGARQDVGWDASPDALIMDGLRQQSRRRA